MGQFVVMSGFISVKPRSTGSLAYAVVSALLVIAVPGFARVPHGVARAVYYKGDWRLDVARDRFSGAVACRLRAHGGRQIYRAGAVGFAVGAPDQTGAAYRIDGGEPVAARDDLAQLIAQRVPLERGGMDDPSGGYVWIPFSRLGQASQVAIEPRPGARPKVVRLAGLVALHDLALQRGCAPDGVFVEQ
jgi:hypothetical protein